MKRFGRPLTNKTSLLLTPLLLACCGSIQAQPPVAPQTQAEIPLITVEQLVETLGKPLKVSLKLENADAKTVLDQFSRQTGLAISTRFLAHRPREAEKPVTLDLKDVSFQQALKAVAEATNVRFENFGNTNKVDVFPATTTGNAPEAPLSSSALGETRVSQIGYFHTRTLSFDQRVGDRPTERLTVSLKSTLDPRIKVLGGFGSKVDEAVDDKGRSLLPVPLRMHPPTMHSSGGIHHTVSIELQPLAQAQRIARLKGSFRLRIVAEQIEWEITDLWGDKPATKEVPGLTGTILTVEPLKRTTYGYELVLKTAPRQVGGNHNTHITDSIFRSVRLLDDKGQELSSGGGSGGGDGREFRATMYFQAPQGEDGPGEPVKLVWTLPTQLRDVDIPFEFKNLPLP
jgi:hypothetical protein